jgi:hypothetical protein
MECKMICFWKKVILTLTHSWTLRRKTWNKLISLLVRMPALWKSTSKFCLMIISISIQIQCLGHLDKSVKVVSCHQQTNWIPNLSRSHISKERNHLIKISLSSISTLPESQALKAGEIYKRCSTKTEESRKMIYEACRIQKWCKTI